MTDEYRNINIDSSFEDRTGLIVWLHSKRNVKRLMSYGVLHYVSNKMDYAIIYVDSKNAERIIEKLNNENFVSRVEQSNLRDLPTNYDNVLDELQKDIDKQKKSETKEDEPLDDNFSLESLFSDNNE